MNRIIRTNIDLKSDIAFLWIGTNDIFVKTKWTLPITKAFYFQPWASSFKDFKSSYEIILKFLENNTKKIFTISPLFIGENFNNRWYHELEKLSKIIEKLTKSNNKSEFIDLRKLFYKKLNSKIISNYIVSSNTSLFLDFMKINNLEKLNNIANERGLHFTVDGVHLNSTGAKIVAQELKS